ncbi:MAG: hypothetical protein ACJ71W_20695 [Terriglobales bacterium]
MKVKVNRRLSAGTYHVNFEVADFTTEEITKMSSFGVPKIQLQWTKGGSKYGGSISLNQISREYDSVFDTEDEARQYEKGILIQIRAAMERLRESQDKYTSSDEVAL